MKLAKLIILLIASILVLSLQACSTISSEARPDLVKALNNLEKEIDTVYLVPCEWPVGMVPGQDTPGDHLYVDEININRHKECYIRHNGLIEMLEKREK